MRVVPLEEIPALGDDEDAVALTFDDAFANFTTEALPVLRDLDLPSTLFVPTGHVGATNDWGGHAQPGIPSLPLLDWDGLEAAVSSGVTLGAHTVTHPHLTRCGAAQVEDELLEAREELAARTGARPLALAYPYGDADERVRDQARRLYRLACTTRFAVLEGTPDPMDLPRLDAFYFRDARRLQSFGSRSFLAWVRWRDRLRSLRRVVGGRG
ncbi:MAG: polysaccharide deacetylase family protein [Gemmatimonadota bacterium]